MTDQAQTLLARAEQARRENRLADARLAAVEALEILRDDGARADLAKVLRGLGEIERKLGHGDAARERYEEAVALYRQEDEPLKLAHTVRHLGDLHQEAGRAELAGPCYEEALALYRNHPQPPAGHLANAVRSMAVHKQQAGATQEAIELWEEAKDLYEVIGVASGVAGSSAQLALLAWREGDEEQARRRLEEAKTAAEACGDPEVRRFVLGVEKRIED